MFFTHSAHGYQIHKNSKRNNEYTGCPKKNGATKNGYFFPYKLLFGENVFATIL